MVHVLISIDDQGNGVPSVKSLTHPVIVGDNVPITPATELGAFLLKAAEVWQATEHMDREQAVSYIDSITIRTPTLN